MRKFITILIVVLLSTMVAQGQIRIGGNVYGGGNHAQVEGSTKVTVKAGDIGAVMDPDASRPLDDPQGKVFGGARMANVGGNTFVHIDGEHATDYILINQVYGGNDIAGTIGTGTVPTELTAVKSAMPPSLPEGKTADDYNDVDNTFNSFVRISTKLSGTKYTQADIDEAGDNEEHPAYAKTPGKDDKPADDAKKVYIGQLFAGGNGDFTYTDDNGAPLMDGDDYIIKQGDAIIARSTSPFVLPELDKTYLEVVGGSIVYGYGGGNNATVKEQNIIHFDNPSAVVNHIKVDANGIEDENGTDLLTTARFKEMGINTTFSQPSSGAYQVGRFFGGNNKAEMHIRPTWNLLAGKIRNLYSGGNRGNMTSPEGLLLEIKDYSTLIVDNLYGGCRMADVMPTVNGVYKPCSNLEGYYFPNQLSARVLVKGGHINNVYGGNDVTGTVYGGNAIGIYATVYGDIYGGGNGNYPYTDSQYLKDNNTFGDFYYELGGKSPVQALNAFRPNAEQVSIHLRGTAPATEGAMPKYTIIHGSVFLGGNCASLATKLSEPKVELKIGSYVIADKVFLGNNGAGMVSENNLKYYAGGIDEDDNDKYTESGGTKFSNLDLLNATTFSQYMDGAAMPLIPSIVFDKQTSDYPYNYEPFSSFIGSFYCGGNVGSMTFPDKESLTIDQGVNIFEKFVGGCNNANVAAGTYNAAYEGGVIGTTEEQSSYTDASGIKDRIEINLENMTITPLRWNEAQTQLMWNTQKWDKNAYFEIEEGTELAVGEKYYTKLEEVYTEHTVTGSSITVGENDEFYSKGGFVKVARDPSDSDIRLLGGNVYGGCYESGHVNGNVIININEELLNKENVFGTKANAIFGNPASGVELEDQRDDLNAVALSVFGAGYGENTEIWGSTTVNHNNGYAFQIYGGGQSGVVGKKEPVKDDQGIIVDYQYQFNPAYSSTVNLNGASAIYSSEGTAEDLAETEYIYGGGNEGDVCGNTLVNLGKGRIYDAFGGASDADILGHAEVYIGRQLRDNNDIRGGYKDGFPWIKDIVYGGNDFGGTIWGEYEDGYNFEARVKDYDATKAAQLHGTPTNSSPGVLKSASYVEFLQGRVDTIFGGGYGAYDYATEYVGSEMPYLENSFVNIRPNAHDYNAIKGVFGGGTGYPKNRDGDASQDHSYVLIDIPDGVEKYVTTEVFGAGSYNGMGMRFNTDETFEESFHPDQLSAIIDLLHGKIRNVFGGSLNEGVTARTVVNVPQGSTIWLYSTEPDKDANEDKYEKQYGNIFGGAYGTQILPPCDVYESNVNYRSSDAVVNGAIYGGNNNERRTLYTHVNIYSPVWSNELKAEKGYLACVYGAGQGKDTWSEYTDVNLEEGAKVYEVYGGGMMGHVINTESIYKYMTLYKDGPSTEIATKDPFWSDDSKWTMTDGKRIPKTEELRQRWAEDWADAWTLGRYFTPVEDENHDGVPEYNYKKYLTNVATNLNNPATGPDIVKKAPMDDRDYSGYSDEEKENRQYKYNTNVFINEGATVVNYAYGGGYGKKASSPEDPKYLSGDVYGSTFIGLLGGTVTKDIYAAGTAGAVDDIFGVGHYYYNTSNPADPKNNPGFTASANVYIKGGTCRNVYGGGWEGNVGNHSGSISDSPASDIPGETHVVIGDLAGSSFASGLPAIQRNAYGGGEGGAVFGSAYLTMNNGYIGYEYKNKEYVEKIEDDTKDSPNTLLEEAGCVFGGGYIDNSSVDKTYVTIYGGNIRNSAFGGGEIAAIGRGDMQAKASGTGYELKGIYRPGKTHLEMYSGHVHRNVYGGGRGYDNLGRVGSLNSAGYIFGQTEVHIHGGEIGTNAGVADGDGNVFGGGDVGFVYSAYEKADGTFGKGVKDGVRYDPLYQGYYYQYEDGKFVTVTIDKDNDGQPDKDKNDNIIYERQFTEDCKVLVEPMCKVKVGVNVGGTDYSVGEYVPIEKLNLLGNKNTDGTKWSCLDETGVIIHNAVFAGGNAYSGSLTTGANTNTVYGNATASINDIYHRDLITLGTRHTGGLYGDGNLTLVDGYRELNITNYGTDYYSIANEITIDAYHKLPEREAAYYELNYTCTKECHDKHGTIYRPADPDNPGSKPATITADDMLDNFLVYNEGTGKYGSFVYDGKAVLQWNPTQEAWEPNPDAGYWVESGVLPVYAGRLMNSIQRADFCGVFGSRMVMQGAQDRVPEEADYTNYTINRVREVSLNKMDSKIQSDLDIPESNAEYYKKHRHGNYFGIYNVVNYLGALTSDVRFSDVRKTDNTNEDYKTASKVYTGGASKPYGEASFYDWKAGFVKERKRNNGNSHNKVALASGVYLEITTEESTGTDLYEKVWGPITGVVELDLINVSTGIGGGFVYAKNVHGIPSESGAENTTLTALNKDAVTQWDYTYDATDDAAHQMEWESSGNFVHSTQTIIDDCYNISNRYYGANKMPAHFWYIKGSTYVYDQYISAYTGQSNAYSEVVDIPLTIAAASHGKMKLLNVMPNRYAYYATPGVPLGDGKKMIINGKTYYKNDPISYWDWYLLSSYEKELFVQKTYTNCITCKIDGTEYAAGTYVMTDTEFTTYKTTFPEGKTKHEYTDADNQPITDADDKVVGDDYIFRESNNVAHDKGYILTYEVNNPSQWDNWYTPKSNTDGSKITLEAYEALIASDASNKAKYDDGPTYHLNISGSTMLGQSEYQHGDIIPETVQSTYTTAYGKLTAEQKAALAPQATFQKAYIVKNKITITEGGHETYYNVGTAVPESFRNNHPDDCEEAYICTKTIEITKDDVIYKDSKMTETKAQSYVTAVKSSMNTEQAGTSEMTVDAIKTSGYSEEKKKKLIALATLRDELQTNLVQAYYCTSEPAVDTEGNPVHYYYGGNYYESGHNYRGLEAWSSMSATDREKFTFNYDALDLLIDKDYTTAASGPKSEGNKYQYDSAAATEDAAKDNAAHYSLETAVDYTAEYNSASPSSTLTKTITVKRGGVSTTTNVLQKGDELSREVFEDDLLNEQRHFAAITVKNATEETTGNYVAYVVKTSFQIGSTPYAVGETISSATYASLSDTEKGYVTKFTFSSTDHSNGAVYYYCRESYTQGTAVTPISSETIPGAGGGVSEGKVQLGTLIDDSNYKILKNEQKNFTIHGVSPTETSTLYVSRESDIYDLSKEKIITVIYQYDYDETDTNGNVTPISERHVVNIHLSFKSGVPTVEDITPPEIILPGDLITMREPTVTPGAYEVLGGGWELFATQRDAESHTNGVEYNPNFDKLYWYQDNYYVAYYAKSYLGRTYSNAVPVSVANYHDLADVMSDENKSHHMYIDHKNVKRDPKIYINDYSASGKNGLDLFKQLYDLSIGTSLEGHAPLNTSQVGSCKNLEFFMRTDINHPESWTPIGTDADHCFDGVFHGDGHTISGLDNSLFNDLCGEVYNLGVMGTFNTAGVVNTGKGYVESCWTKTTATTPLETKPYPVFGAPSDNKGYQVVNSYYYDGNKGLYTTNEGDAEITYTNGSKGKVTGKSAKAFFNGELAYDLNNFYLHKRYSDQKVITGSKKYSYFTIDNENKLVLKDNHYYANRADLCSTGYEYNSNVIMYVEDRFADGDFRFAAGVIPETEDERCHEESVTVEGVTTTQIDFYPIWPDDYIFFGQKLTYGYNTHAHQEVPTAVVRDGGRLSKNEDANRVYRAPAYFRSKDMGVAYFNPAAYLAQKENPETVKEGDTPREAYPGMTAIDFADHRYYETYEGYETYHDKYGLGLTAASGSVPQLFYPPLLDDDGLLSIQNCDETQNLLVYAPAASGDGYVNEKTHGVLTSYFVDPAYDSHYDYAGGYRLVSENTDNIHGHLVQSDLTATNDHLLVDKQDFNAPLAYSFDADHLMWYQRKPGLKEYVDLNSGWQGISLPFTAELVTTDTKGEITHFYSGSETSKNGTGTKIGHEYWLREFNKIKEEGTEPSIVAKADFVYPTAAGATREVTNTFLWDYYYEKTDRKDKNSDIYQEYYRNERNYPSYPLLTAATPYILGLPGSMYYEFDLSGKFVAQNTAVSIPQVAKQVITFASNKKANIGVSDDEMAGVTVKYSGQNYTFKPSYMNENLEAGDYVMNSDGNAYVKLSDVTETYNTTGSTYANEAAFNAAKAAAVGGKLYTDADGIVEASWVDAETTYYSRVSNDPITKNEKNNVTTAQSAFRPYFIMTAKSPSPKRTPQSIIFGNDYSSMEGEPQSALDGRLEIYAKDHKIITTSHLKDPVAITIVSVAGITYTSYMLQPGETIETPVHTNGVYIVNRKKLLVK